MSYPLYLFVSISNANERTVENLVMEVECNKAVVSIDGSVVVEVEGVDVTRMKRGSKAKVEAPFFLPEQLCGGEKQQNE